MRILTNMWSGRKEYLKTLNLLWLCANALLLHAQACDVKVPCDCCSDELSCHDYSRYYPYYCIGPCKDGYWGGRCINKCPEVCVDCSQNFGNSDECYKCIDGHYGLNCSTLCREGCVTCTKDAGICTHCIPGFYGPTCTDICPPNCENRRCFLYTGNCYGCEEEYRGVKCLCLNTCLTCEKQTGNCSECNAGYFGTFCDKRCPPGCRGICEKTTGLCINGCVDGSSISPYCCANSTYCETCSSHTHCTLCTPGKYGENCDKNCPMNCFGACDRVSGVCNAAQSNAGYKVAVAVLSLVLGGVTITIAVFIIRKRRFVSKETSEAQETNTYDNLQQNREATAIPYTGVIITTEPDHQEEENNYENTTI